MQQLHDMLIPQMSGFFLQALHVNATNVRRMFLVPYKFRKRAAVMLRKFRVRCSELYRDKEVGICQS